MVAYSAGAEWWRPVVGNGPVPPGTTAARGSDSAIPFRALMVFTFILLLSPQTFVPGLGHLRIALLTGAFAVVVHCWPRFAARQPLMRFTRETWLAGGLLGWAVLTLPLSEWLGGSVQVLLDLYLKALIIFWLVSNTVTTLGRLRVVAWGLSLMAAPLAATGVWDFISHRDMLGGRIAGYDAPLTGNPNDLALMLNLILPLTIALFLISRQPTARALLAGLIVLSFTAIIVTFSRGGFLTLMVIFILYLRALQKRGKWNWVVAALVLAFAAVPLLPQGYLGRLGTITDINADQTGSAEARWGDTQTALTFALEHPVVGAGLGQNDLALNNLRGPTWQYVHNVYLEYAVDLGWPGVGLFLLLLASSIRSAARVRKLSTGFPALRDLSALAEAIQIALMAFAVAGFFYPVAYSYYFYYFAALAVGAKSIHEAEAHAVAGTPTLLRKK